METIECEDDIHITHKSAVSCQPKAVSLLPQAAVRCALNFKATNYYHCFYNLLFLQFEAQAFRESNRFKPSWGDAN